MIRRLIPHTLLLAQKGQYVTHALLAVWGPQDVIDAGHGGGDVLDVAAVIPGWLDLVGAEHYLLEAAHHHGLLDLLQPRKPRHSWNGLGLKEEAREKGQGENNLHAVEILLQLTACCCLQINFIGLLSALSDDSKFPDKWDLSVKLHFFTHRHVTTWHELIKYDVKAALNLIVKEKTVTQCLSDYCCTFYDIWEGWL